MDKWFSNPWVIKAVSVLIAVMLFLMVNMDNRNVNTQPGEIPGITDGSKVLEDVPLTILYDEDRYVVTDAPETVQVTLRGPQNILTVSQLARPQYEVFVDLRDKEAGDHYERVRHDGFPQDLSVSIVPMTVRVTMQEKQTVSFPVQIDLENQGELEEGYTIGTPTVNPSAVDVTAAQGIIEQIASVRTSVDVSGRNSPFQENGAVIVLDQNGNEIPVNTDPPAVEVTVPITSPNKEVPVNIEREGEVNEGLAIDSITANPDTVTIYGPVDVINDISFIDGISVDLGEITGDTTFEVDVPVPDGVERVEPETVIIEVETTEEETYEFSDVEIEIIGLSEGQNYTFLSPSEGLIDIVVMGSPNVLDRLERDDIQVFVNAEELEDGEHELPIEYRGPQNIRVEKGRTDVNFIVYERGSENSQVSDSDGEEDENTS
ncbi:YbbR-like domain-containing protein [Bacillus shivajii]|uniref:CdaR family protein n=1 Tax=Bacillus shivajii TaxID=1983719 RepID=UPI001CF9CD64|nr:CdaR family protein [Bacillus shivajii]UCZ53420.1 YbbR-like domain-containing protein [Bacillus shivajii]